MISAIVGFKLTITYQGEKLNWTAYSFVPTNNYSYTAQS